jgi:hypothetical protein
MKNDCMCNHKQIVYKNTFVMHPFTPETENIEFNEVTKNKMIFRLTGYVHEQFSFIIKLIKKKMFVINPNKNKPLLVQFDQTIRTKCQTTRLNMSFGVLF